MPDGLPSATTVLHDATGIETTSYKRVTLRKGDKVQILGRAADQDGFDGEVLIQHRQQQLAVNEGDLRL